MRNSHLAALAANDQDTSSVDLVQARIDLLKNRLADINPVCGNTKLFHLCSWIKSLGIDDKAGLKLVIDFRIRAHGKAKDETTPREIQETFKRATAKPLDGWARKFFGGFSEAEKNILFEDRGGDFDNTENETLSPYEQVSGKYRALRTVEDILESVGTWHDIQRLENKASEHAYILRKGIKPLGGAFYSPDYMPRGYSHRDLLLVPLRHPGYLFDMPYAFQAISGDGKLKRLPANRQGYIAHFTHGAVEPETVTDKGVVIVAEGYGQACTVAELTGCTSVITLGKWAFRYVGYLFATGDLEAEYVLFVPDVGKGAEKEARIALEVLREASDGEIKAGYVIPRKPDGGKAPSNYDINDMALEDREATRELLLEAIERLKAGQLNDTPATGFLLGSNGKLLPQNQAARALAERLPMIGYDPVRMAWRRYSENCWWELPDTEIRRVVNEQIAEGAPTGYSIQLLRGCMAFLELELCRRFGESPRHLIPFKNGVLDLMSLGLLPHSPEHGFTWTLNHAYEPGATCEPFVIWLREVLQDEADVPADVEEKVGILRAFIKAMLTGRADLQRFLALIGPPGTGKGTILRILEELIGTENVHVTDFRSLEGSRFETAKLYGKRLLVITDAEGFSEELTTFKAATGYDSLRYEEKNKQAGASFKFQGVTAIAANSEPKSKDLSGALHRRQVSLYFRNVVPPDRRRNLEAEFRPLLPGIVNWALSMSDGRMVRLLVDTNQASRSARSAAIEALRNSNPVARWMDENLVYSDNENSKVRIGIAFGKTAAEEARVSLYANYVTWCESAGIKPADVIRFSNGLQSVLKLLGVQSMQHKSERDGKKLCRIELRGEGDKAHEDRAAFLTWASDPANAAQRQKPAGKVSSLRKSYA